MARRQSLDERIERSITITEAGCWEWQLARNRQGYGWMKVDGRQLGAHRVVYEHLVGPIPEGLTIDHLCRNKGCVNPEHLEAVTHAVNIQRQRATITHCPQGHAYAEYGYRHGGRLHCRECRRVRHRRWVNQQRSTT